MRTTAAAGCAVAVAVLLGTAGCGGPHHAHAAAEKGRTPAPSKTTAAPSPRPTQNAAGRAVTAMANRVEGLHSARIATTQEHTGGTVIMTGTQTWGRAGAGTDLTVPPVKLGMDHLNHARRMEVRYVGGAEYVRIDAASGGPLKGKTWLRYTGAKVLGGEGADTMDRTSERSPVDFLRGSATAGQVTRVGRETMAGRKTTRYRGSFTTGAALRQRGVPAAAEFDVWVGDDGLPVRLVCNYEDEFTTTDFLGFGGDHPVAPPPVSRTADMTATGGTPQ